MKTLRVMCKLLLATTLLSSMIVATVLPASADYCDDYFSGCQHYECTEFWGSDQTIEVHFYARPRVQAGTPSDRAGLAGWSPTSAHAGGPFWPQMLITVTWGIGGSAETEVVTINEEGEADSPGSHPNVILHNGTTTLCDDFVGKSHRFADSGGCVIAAEYRIDVRDTHPDNSACVYSIAAHPLDSSPYLDGQLLSECPSGTDLNYVPSGPYFHPNGSCHTLTPVIYWYSTS